MGKRKKVSVSPTVAELERELRRTLYRKKYWSVLRSTVYILVTVAAVAILIASLWVPVLQIYGSSMTPTLQDGELVLALKNHAFHKGEVVAFYYNNKILIKRVIALPGEWVDIDKDGRVYVNQVLLDEPYIEEFAYGDCNIELPYQVPDSRIFVMGDHRATSVDSRNTAIGCISEEQIVGRLLLRIWPGESFGPIG